MKACGSQVAGVLLVLYLVEPRSTAALELDGTRVSYVKFRTLPSCQNVTSFSFEFVTSRATGLLLYSELGEKGGRGGGGGGGYTFLDLRLVRGAVVFRFNYGAGSRLLTVGDNYHDNKRHSVKIEQSGDWIKLFVDDVIRIYSSPAGEFHRWTLTQPTLTGESFVYFGGVPLSFESHLGFMALPSVFFEQHFQGSIYAVLYWDCEGRVAVTPEMLEGEGVRTNVDDSCLDHNPCQNQGECSSTDVGPNCDCSRTDFTGTLCHSSKEPLV